MKFNMRIASRFLTLSLLASMSVAFAQVGELIGDWKNVDPKPTKRRISITRLAMTRLAIKTAVTVLTTLMMMTIAATAATITISDLLDGNPIVTTSADLTGAETTLSFEKAVISGLLPAGVQLPVGTRSVILATCG